MIMIRKSLKKFQKKLDTKFMRVCAKSRLLSSFYYLTLNGSFEREHQAVLVGKLKHLDESRIEKGNYFLLTRNIHRIEKGLLMRPRRPVFAKEYLVETIDSFEGIWMKSGLDKNPQIKWFHDVLAEYFALSGPDLIIDEQRVRFVSIVTRRERIAEEICFDHKSVPYSRPHYDHAISYEKFMLLAKQRRSVRWFENRPVAREVIDKAILAANQSPSACNRQPYEFRVFDEPELVSKVSSIPMGTKGYASNIPVFVVLIGNLDAYFDERDRHVIYVDASLAAMSFMLALETLGLSSCAINWPDIEAKEKQMAKLLSLPDHQRPVMCLAIGYSDRSGKVAYSEKRPLDMIRKYNDE